MNIGQVLATYQREGRYHQWPEETVLQLAGVTRRSSSDGTRNMVTAYDLKDEEADRAIEQEIAFFRERGQSFEWKAFSYDTPNDLLERLARHGLTVADREAVVVYDLADGLEPFEIDSACTVKRIDEVGQLAEFQRVADLVFCRDNSSTVAALARMIETNQPGHDAYIAYIDGVPAAVGRLYTNADSAFAGLYGGGTLPEFRSRGLYRSIIAARAKDAMAFDAQYLVVDALTTSLPILLCLGFTHLADSWPCSFDV